ncbi:hypothetical protein B0A54_14459 [Friedmanniomyces endolithicus]|uniref:Uncharacterized protein n=1 Tax=Friedmanniomyces endolithicus TaxID=329885 RepID=A0A4U0UAJ4_9PEZI|nr:hypothetical protein B0A54_14459 [Friedmanniomyces endolithicus]
MPQNYTIDWPMMPPAYQMMAHFLDSRTRLPPPPKRHHHHPQKPLGPATSAPKKQIQTVASDHSSKWSTAGTVGTGGGVWSSKEGAGTVVAREMMPGGTRYVTNEEWRDKRGRVLKRRTTVCTTRKEA